jgi:hypothetical protein
VLLTPAQNRMVRLRQQDDARLRPGGHY